jgi:hypothetical protein
VGLVVVKVPQVAEAVVNGAEITPSESDPVLSPAYSADITVIYVAVFAV